MKKILLAAAILAVASLNSFGAACVNGTMAAQILAGACQINGWTLDTWSIGQANSNGYTTNLAGLTPAFNQGSIQVSFGIVSLAGAPGFSVTFSDSAAAGNFFQAVPGNPNQSANWNSNFSILNVSNGPIKSVDLLVTGASVNSPDLSGQISVQKIIYNPLAPPPGSASLGDRNVLTTHGAQSPNPVGINIAGNILNRISVADVYQITAGNTGTGGVLTSYTNSFYGTAPDTGIPEPMTFVLMGFGLVGVAALRRRNG